MFKSYYHSKWIFQYGVLNWHAHSCFSSNFEPNLQKGNSYLSRSLLTSSLQFYSFHNLHAVCHCVYKKKTRSRTYSFVSYEQRTKWLNRNSVNYKWPPVEQIRNLLECFCRCTGREINAKQQTRKIYYTQKYNKHLNFTTLDVSP